MWRRRIAPPSQAGVGFGLYLGSSVLFCLSPITREMKLRRKQGPAGGGVGRNLGRSLPREASHAMMNERMNLNTNPPKLCSLTSTRQHQKTWPTFHRGADGGHRGTSHANPSLMKAPPSTARSSMAGLFFWCWRVLAKAARSGQN